MGESQSKRAVLVTTEYRGVFFGYLDPKCKDTDRVLTLNNCRCAIYWSGKSGFLGLASSGPELGSKIGSRADRVVLQGVCSVADCTPGAVAVWEAWA